MPAGSAKEAAGLALMQLLPIVGAFWTGCDEQVAVGSDSVKCYLRQCREGEQSRERSRDLHRIGSERPDAVCAARVRPWTSVHSGSFSRGYVHGAHGDRPGFRGVGLGDMAASKTDSSPGSLTRETPQP